MFVVGGIKLRPEDAGSKEKLIKKISVSLKCGVNDIKDIRILRESIDARKKPDVFLVYEAGVFLKKVPVNAEEEYIKSRRLKNVKAEETKSYAFLYSAKEGCGRPVVMGMGPAGLFNALVLARAGFRPVVFERGNAVDERCADVSAFWNGRKLNPESNVQFGEGGAGTFSDGKLNTLIKGSKDIHRYVMEQFVSFGAAPDILYSFRPHIGTDVLRTVVKNIRNEILECGGEIHFCSRIDDIIIKDGKLSGIIYTEDGVKNEVSCGCLCVACGHSARDTFAMLRDRGVFMEPKPFAVGFRVEHPQDMINESQYGSRKKDLLPAASYKLTARTKNGRSVYSFCMCPGGYVVNASSEINRLAVNGMSYSGRDGETANSAIVCAVSPKDFSGFDGVFCGVEFQRHLEETAYRMAGGSIPLQTVEDYFAKRRSHSLGDVRPCVKGSWDFSDLNPLFTEALNDAFKDAMRQFSNRIKGFDRPDALMLGVESRTSSPVRILRDAKTLQSSIGGIFPCGEGAGYAGGITSAAIDGIRCAQAMASFLLTN